MRLVNITAFLWVIVATAIPLTVARGGEDGTRFVETQTTTTTTDDAPAVGTLSVTGQATETQAPNMAMISTGVSTIQLTAEESLTENSDVMERIMTVLKVDFGINETDIQTTSFSINAEYDYRYNEEGGGPTLIGYRVTNLLSVKIMNLDDLGLILDALVVAGSNQLGGISFGIDDPDESLWNSARQKAVGNAKVKADLYAAAAGLTVGRVLTMTEPGALQYQGDKGAMDAPMYSEAARVPVASGESQITATIHVVYEVLPQVA